MAFFLRSPGDFAGIKRYGMKDRKMTHHEFSRLFKTKPRKGGYDCYGTWNCSDISYWGDTEENARIEAYKGLVKSGFLLTNEENEHRNSVLAKYASMATPA